MLQKLHIPPALSRFALSPLGLLLLVSLLFFDGLRGRLMFAPYPRPTEFLSQWLPYLLFARESIRAGEFPLWCHNLQAGFPLGAFPHAALYYPLVLPFAILGFVPAYTLFIWLHLAARIFLMHGLLREWPVPPFAAWLGAALYVLGGSSLHLTGHLVMFTTAAWVPGIFWLALRLVRYGRRRDFILLAFLSALAYLAGDLEILLYAGIILILMLAYVEAAPLRALARVALAGGAGLLMVAAPFLLTINYLHHSFRQAQAFNSFATLWREIAVFAAAPWITFSSLPMIGQKYWWYVGFLLPLGFIASLRDPEARARRHRRLILLALAGAVLFAANVWPLSLLFNALPILKYTGADMRFKAFIPLLCLVLPAAAAGLSRVTDSIEPRTQRRLAAFLVFFILLQAAVAAIELLIGAPDLPVIASRAVLIAALIVLAVLFTRSRRAAPRPAVRPVALVLILFLDLYVLALLAVPRTNPGQLTDPPVSIPELSQARDPDRLHLSSNRFDDPEMWRFFRLDRGPGFIFGFIRNGLKAPTELYFAILNRTLHPFDPAIINSDNLPLFEFLAVRYLLSHSAGPPSGDQFVAVTLGGPFQLDQNRDALDHYGLYTAALSVSGPEARALLFDPRRFDPSRQLILAPEFVSPAIAAHDPAPRHRGEVTVREYTNNRVVLDADLAAPAYLSIAESYYPGWRAEVNGRPAPIVPANYAYQAVPLTQAGPQKITLTFAPVEFGIGLWASLAASVMALAMVMPWKR